MDDGYTSKKPTYNRQDQISHYLTQVDRLKTFENWAFLHPTPFILSKLGFIYTGIADELQCTRCSHRLRNWVGHVNPLIEHYKLNNKCEFVISFKHILLNIRMNDGFSGSSFCFEKSYNSVEMRILSFGGINLPSFLDVQSLAHSGFYYLGPRDRVTCYSCDIILVDWESVDIPIGEHYRWNPDCAHVQTCLKLLDESFERVLTLDVGMPVGPTYLSTNVLTHIFSRDNEYQFSNRESAGFSNRELPNANSQYGTSGIAVGFPVQNTGTNRESLITQSQDDDKTPYLIKELRNYDAAKCVQAKPSTSSFRESTTNSQTENEEEILSKMFTSPQVLATQEIFDFPQQVLETVIRKHYQKHHKEFDSAEDLCNAIMAEIEQGDSKRNKESVKFEVTDCKPTMMMENDPGGTDKVVPSIAHENSKSQTCIPPAVKNLVSTSSHFEKLPDDFSSVPCKICLDRDVTVIFLPCRHLVTCEECSKLVKECPICRKHIQERMKIYLS